MKILVSGGAGYLGSVLVGKLLQTSHGITVIDNLMYGQTSLFQYCSNPYFKFFKGDIRDKQPIIELLEDTDIYIPLAAIVGAPACKIHQEVAKNINYYALIENVLAMKKGIVIYPTTNSGYGTKSYETICTEETPLEPISDYGIQKVSAEKWLVHEPSRTIALRLATVFGPSTRMRTDLLVNNFVYKALRNRCLFLYEPEFIRNYLHIEDFADCVIHCINNKDEMVGESYNVGLYDGNYSKLQLAQKVQEFIDCEIFIGEGSDPDKRNYMVSNDKLAKTGFKAVRSIKLGIAQLIELYNMMPRGNYSNV